MKILLVEDDTEKLRRLAAALSAVAGVDIARDVLHCATVHDALGRVHENYFDLVVLDLVVPLRMDQAPDATGGITFLERVLARPGYHVPGHVIGLTAYDGAFQDAFGRFDERALTLLRYDPTSAEWETRLQARVRHIEMSLTAARRVPPSFDSFAAVVCALETPELEQVLALPWHWEQVSLPGDPTMYFRGRCERDGNERVVYAAAQTRMGMPAAAALTMKLLAAFRPRHVAMTGITAGVRGRARIGDVLAADPSWDWGSGKWVVRNDVEKFLAAPHQLPLDASMRATLLRVGRDGAALERIRREWPGERPPHAPRVLVGPVASGASVLADAGTLERVVEQHRQLLGIEMETYGVFAAVHDTGAPRPAVFSVKAVVDFADGEKNDEHQGYGAYVSARVLQLLVEEAL